MRKVTLWSSATSVDLRVSLGVVRRCPCPWAEAMDGAREAETRRRPSRSEPDFMDDPFHLTRVGEAGSAWKGHLTGPRRRIQAPNEPDGRSQLSMGGPGW